MFDFRAGAAVRTRIRASVGRCVIGPAVAIAVAVTSLPAWAGDHGTARGRRIAEASCAPCHAVGTSGESPKAAAPPFRELGRRYSVESLEEALAEGVMVGHPEMPRVRMKETDIAAFVAYLKSIQVP